MCKLLPFLPLAVTLYFLEHFTFIYSCFFWVPARAFWENTTHVWAFGDILSKVQLWAKSKSSHIIRHWNGHQPCQPKTELTPTSPVLPILCSQLVVFLLFPLQFCYVQVHREIPDPLSSLQGEMSAFCCPCREMSDLRSSYLLFFFTFHWISKIKISHHAFHILPSIEFGWSPNTLASSANMKWLRKKDKNSVESPLR